MGAHPEQWDLCRVDCDEGAAQKESVHAHVWAVHHLQDEPDAVEPQQPYQRSLSMGRLKDPDDFTDVQFVEQFWF